MRFTWYYFARAEPDGNFEPNGVLYAFYPIGASLSMLGILTTLSTPQWPIHFLKLPLVQQIAFLD